MDGREARVPVCACLRVRDCVCARARAARACVSCLCVCQSQCLLSLYREAKGLKRKYTVQYRTKCAIFTRVGVPGACVMCRASSCRCRARDGVEMISEKVI